MPQSITKFKEAILVTGGSGYVGSVFVDYYARRRPDQGVVVVARTKKAHLQFPPNVQFIQGDYGDLEKMEQIMRKNQITQVLHMAADLNNDNAQSNIVKSQALFDAMDRTGVERIVYSSTLMVYEPPTHSNGRLSEDHPTKQPSASNYPASKRAVEEMISQRKAWRSVILRYGIAIGSSADCKFGDARPSLGIVATYLDAAQHTSTVTMADDGSAARDFVDVQDIASANDKALAWTRRQKNPGTLILNVGTGQPRSINQLIQTIEQVTKMPVRVKRSSNLPNVSVSFLDTSLIKKTLGWEPEITFEESIKNAWQFHGKAAKS